MELVDQIKRLQLQHAVVHLVGDLRQQSSAWVQHCPRRLEERRIHEADVWLAAQLGTGSAVAGCTSAAESSGAAGGLMRRVPRNHLEPTLRKQRGQVVPGSVHVNASQRPHVESDSRLVSAAAEHVACAVASTQDRRWLREVELEQLLKQRRVCHSLSTQLSAKSDSPS